MQRFNQQSEKQRYQKPEITDQGSVIAKTRATQCGQQWDGSPDNDDDTMHDTNRF